MKYTVGAIIVIILSVLSFRLLSGPSKTSPIVVTPEPPLDLRPQIIVGGKSIKMDLATTSDARGQGLSGRPSLAEDEGLLFIFDRPAKYSFWMKDMNFSIDIIWMDESFKITGLKSNATPESYPESFKPEQDSLYVLEVNKGLIQSQNLKIGDELKFSK